MPPRAKASETRARIEATALELFATQGLQHTSLQQIADRLGLTKPALYYHFASREDLLRSLVQPLIDEVEGMLATAEDGDAVAPRALLESFFDITHRHRTVNQVIVGDLSALAFLDLGVRVVDWRRRITALLVGRDATLAARARAIVAVGGLADCTVMFPDVPLDELRRPAVEAACAALFGDPTPPG